MRIIQIRTAIQYGDGMGNTMVLFDKILSKKYDTLIAVRLHSKEFDEYDNIVKFNDVRELNILKDDILLIHFGERDELIEELFDYGGKRVIVYQNVTYPYFFAEIDNIAFSQCAEGQRFIRSTIGSFLKAIAPSYFSKNELLEMGWNEEDVYHLPLPVLSRSSGVTRIKKRKERNFLFVGRIVPNKKIEDVIRVFDYYSRNYYCNSKLKLIGSIYYEAYYDALQKYINRKQIKNVEFLNHVSDEELEEIYSESDIYLCMSEHEGFCMPLIEAMSYEIPVVAYNATAVPDTMGGAGILLESKEPHYVCELIDKVFEDVKYREALVEKQSKHVNDFIREDYEDRLFHIIEDVKSITSYSYDNTSYDFYKLLMNEVRDENERTLYKYFQRIEKNKRNLVLYGFGKVGKQLLSFFKKYEIGFDAICDSGVFGEYIYDKEILSPEACVGQFPEATYIITVQNKEIVSEIIANLKELGLAPDNIILYSNKNKMLLV